MKLTFSWFATFGGVCDDFMGMSFLIDSGVVTLEEVMLYLVFAQYVPNTTDMLLGLGATGSSLLGLSRRGCV